MKKLIVTSILAVSFLTASATQLLESEVFNDTITTETYPVVVDEETDEPFDFNTEDYLPLGFNPTLSLDENYDLEFSLIVEEDESFEFNTEDYLPVGFNLNKEILNGIIEIANVEEDESLDFDTKKYLPKGFDPAKKNGVINEL